MNSRLKLMRILVTLGALLLVAIPTPALAHDNLGGDELAVANWMLVGAVITIVMGVLAGIWAARAGQFSNIEDSKYRMIETAEDYDAIMAEAELHEKLAGQARAVDKSDRHIGAEPAVASGGRADSTARI